MKAGDTLPPYQGFCKVVFVGVRLTPNWESPLFFELRNCEFLRNLKTRPSEIHF